MLRSAARGHPLSAALACHAAHIRFNKSSFFESLQLIYLPLELDPPASVCARSQPSRFILLSTHTSSTRPRLSEYSRVCSTVLSMMSVGVKERGLISACAGPRERVASAPKHAETSKRGGESAATTAALLRRWRAWLPDPIQSACGPIHVPLQMRLEE